MKVFNTVLQWFFWIIGLAGLCAGVAIALAGSWTSGIAASMICCGTLVPLGNFFKNRRELSRLNANPR
jgi:hypothetical protein